MTYLSIDAEERYTTIADAIVSREQEVFSYQLNIDNYTAMLAASSDLAEEWPESIAQYKNMNPTALASVVPEDLLDLVNEYSYRDRIKFLLKTEKIEQLKSQKVLAALISQLPADRLTELVNAAKAKLVIQRQKALG